MLYDMPWKKDQGTRERQRKLRLDNLAYDLRVTGLLARPRQSRLVQVVRVRGRRACVSTPLSKKKSRPIPRTHDTLQVRNLEFEESIS